MEDKLTNKDVSELIAVIIVSVIMMCIGFFLGYFGRIHNEPINTKPPKQEIIKIKCKLEEPKNTIEIGKHYILDFTDYKNPFSEKAEYEIEILDIKQGYVKYKYVESGRIESREIDYILRNLKTKDDYRNPIYISDTSKFIHNGGKLRNLKTK